MTDQKSTDWTDELERLERIAVTGDIPLPQGFLPPPRPRWWAARHGVYRQSSHLPDKLVSEHRFGWFAEWRAHRRANREQDTGVFYTAYPLAATVSTFPAWQRAWRRLRNTRRADS